jgi:hypothetical protein
MNGFSSAQAVAYHNNAALHAALQSLAQQYPHLIEVREVGRSFEGQPIWLATLTDRRTGAPRDKPAVWLDGNTHAAELAGASVCLFALAALCERWTAGDPLVTGLLARRALVVLPRVNPDGAEQVLRTGAPLRASTRRWPRQDGPLGWVPGDVDSDGKVRQIRVESPSGAWKLYAADPRVLVPREPDDASGPFYHLYREGKFSEEFDPDKLDVRPHPQGLDFNRNYPYGWRPEHRQKGAGPHPLSEPETRAHVEAFLSFPRIGAAITYHTYCGAILRPFSDKPDSDMDAQDLSVFKAIGKRGEALTGYKCISVFHEFRYTTNDVISGAFDDWAYNDRGVLAFTIEIWNAARAAGIQVESFADFFFLGHRTPEQTKQILDWCVQNAPDSYADWRPFHHPQLGPVEIGGWDRLYSWQNPPLRELTQECEKNLAFVLCLMQALPVATLQRWEVEPVGEGLHRVTAVVENLGWLPSSGTALGKKFCEPARAQLQVGPHMALVVGERELELGHLAGASDVTLGSFADASYFPGVARRSVGKAEWVVSGSGEVAVVVDAARAGVVVCPAKRV